MLEGLVKNGSKTVFYKDGVQVCLKLHKILSEYEFLVIDQDNKNQTVLNKNECYTLDFYNPDGLYRCNAYIISIYSKDGAGCYKARTSSQLKKVDRRMYHRYPCHALFSYSAIQKAQVRDILDGEWQEVWKEIAGVQWFKHAPLVDISGGGLRFTSRQRLNKGDYLVCTLDFGEYNKKNKEKILEAFPIMCEVVYVEKIVKDRNVFDIRLKYTGITERQREQIIHFVFWLERQRG